MHDIHSPSILELDDSLVARLYQQLALFLMTYVRRHVPSREEAEDVLFDIFLAALEHSVLERFHEEDAILYRKLAELPAAYQKVLQLRFAYGLRCQEIARRLNKSEGAMRMLLSRALTFLRKVYTEQ